MMKPKVTFSVLLGSALVGLIALGTARTDAQTDSRVGKEDARSPKVEKVEANHELPVLESAIVFEGAPVTEAEAAEISQAILGHLAGTERPEKKEPAVQTVETSGGTLAIVDRGNGRIQIIAFAIDHEHPDPQSPDQGVAFSAAISKDGVEVLSTDVASLARFVGVDVALDGRSLTEDESRNGGTPVSQVVERYVFSDFERSTLVDGGAVALDLLPTRAQIESLKDADTRSVVLKAIELSERAMQADAMTDEELQSYLIEMSLFSAILRVGIEQGSGRSASMGGSQTAVDNGGPSPVLPQTPGECTTDCHTRRNQCLEQECWDDRGWPCFCCIGCNLMELVCYTACIFQAAA